MYEVNTRISIGQDKYIGIGSRASVCVEIMTECKIRFPTPVQVVRENKGPAMHWSTIVLLLYDA